MFFSDGSMSSTDSAQFLLLSLLMKYSSKRDWGNSHVLLLFSHGARVAQPKESDLGRGSLAESVQTKLAAQSSSLGLRARKCLS